MLTTAEIEALVQRIVARARPRRVIVFGSYAKGTATKGSDLDIVVVKETELPMARRADGLRGLLSSSLVPVDVHVLTPEEVDEYAGKEFSFVNSVLTSGWTVFDDGSGIPELLAVGSR